MKYLLIAILLLGACSAQYFSQEEVEASFENDLKDLDALTKDMDFDENFDFLEGAEDEEDPFDFEEEDEMDDELAEEEPEEDFEDEEDEEDEDLDSYFIRMGNFKALSNFFKRVRRGAKKVV